MARKAVYKHLPKDGINGKTNLISFKNKRGIYKIYENAKLIYVGSSTSNLYKTILRHFQAWSDSRQLRRISYKGNLGKKSYTFEVILMPKCSEEQIGLKEYQLVQKHEPRDNKLNLYCGMTGADCQSKLDLANEKLKKKKKKKPVKKKKPKKKDDDFVPF